MTNKLQRLYNPYYYYLEVYISTHNKANTNTNTNTYITLYI